MRLSACFVAIAATLLLASSTPFAQDAPLWPPGFRFQVIAAGNSAILVDTASGQSWRLSESGSGWNPLPFSSAAVVVPGAPPEAFFPPPTKMWAYDPKTGKLVPLDPNVPLGIRGGTSAP